MVSITLSTAQMAKLILTVGLIKDGVPRVLAPTINRTLATGRTVVKREIREHYIIKAKDIPITVRNATRATLGGEIRIQSGMLDLNKFKVSPRGIQRRKNKVTLHAQVKVGGGGNLPGAFMTGMAYPGPFIRKGAARLPIKKLLTIGAPIMASQPSVGPAVNKAMGDTFDKRLDHEMSRLLGK